MQDYLSGASVHCLTLERSRSRLTAVSAIWLFTACFLVAPASAQRSCESLDLTGAACARYQGQYGVISLFGTPAYSTPNNPILNNNLAIEQGIYLNATPAQRNQAIANSQAGGEAPQLAQYTLWKQISPSSEIQSTLRLFPQLQASAPLAIALTEALSPLKPVQQGVYREITETLGRSDDWPKPIGTIQGFVGEGLKDSFTSYVTAYQGMTTPYYYPPPDQSDPRPFQISNVIASAPWTTGQATEASIQAQAAIWGKPGQGSRYQKSESFPSGHTRRAELTALLYAMMMPQAYQGMMVSAQQAGLSRNILGVHYPLDVIGSRIVSYYAMTQILAGNPDYVPAVWGPASLPQHIAALSSDLTTSLNETYGSAVTAVPYASCASNVAGCIANGTLPSAAQFAAANTAFALQATYGFQPVGPTDLAAVVPANAELLIASRFPYLSSAQRTAILASTELPSGGVFDDGSGWVRLNLFKAAGGYGAFASNVSVTLDSSLGGFNAVDMWSNDISGPGGLTKAGTGLLILGGNDSYTGGTTVAEGTVALSGTLVGDLAIRAGAAFVSGGGYSVAPGATLDNAGTFQSVNASLVNFGTFDNSGTLLSNLVNSGTTTNTGTINGSVYNTGNFIQAAGTFANSRALINNGTFTGNVNNTGLLGGNGTFVGTVTNSGIVAPGNSIGTLTVNGAYTQVAGSSYQVETNAAGQADRLNVTGAPGTATIAGGSVAVTAASGVYAPSTTYTIVNASGGVTGSYAGASSLYPFLLPSLAYDANNVYLTLKPGGFGVGGATPNQSAVGRVLDQSVAGSSGDFATVIGTMATYTLGQGQAALDALSGQNYSGFGTANLGSGLLFMNMMGQQMSLARGGVGSGTRVAVAQACDVAPSEACDGDTVTPWSLWGAALGGTGSVAGTANAGTLTYNAGGFAAGADYRFDPRFLAGIAVGYVGGNQWASGFSGQGTTNSYQASLYASFTQGAFYLDGLAGYGYNDNQMTRQIVLPNLSARLAQGRTGANQFLGQLEAGYRIGLHEPTAASITPFARLQGTTNSQFGFTESGAGSLNLNVASQTTGSARSVLGAEFAGAFGPQGREKLAVQLRLGWAHEYADTTRPVTASFAGAPGTNFTVFGAAPARDAATFSLAANTAVAPGTTLYVRYDGETGSGTTNHVLNGGLRVTW